MLLQDNKYTFLSHILVSWKWSCVFQQGLIHSQGTCTHWVILAYYHRSAACVSHANILLSSEPSCYGLFIKNWFLKQITIWRYFFKGSQVYPSTSRAHFSLMSSHSCFHSGFFTRGGQSLSRSHSSSEEKDDLSDWRVWELVQVNFSVSTSLCLLPTHPHPLSSSCMLAGRCIPSWALL